MSKASEVKDKNSQYMNINDSMLVKHPEFGNVLFTRLTERQKDVLKAYRKNK